MKFKLLAVAAATAVSFNAMAQESSAKESSALDRLDAVSELIEEVFDDAFDNYSGEDGFAGLDTAILSAAINVEHVDAFVEITGRDLTLNAGSSNVSATATAEALESVAKATAINGIDITTLAAGAINSSSVHVSAYQFGEDLSYGDENDGYGEDFSMTEIDVPYTAIVQGAINVGHVDASVHIHADAIKENAYYTSGGALNAANIAINTTALGAVNSGIVRVGADLIEAATRPVAP